MAKPWLSHGYGIVAMAKPWLSHGYGIVAMAKPWLSHGQKGSIFKTFGQGEGRRNQGNLFFLRAAMESFSCVSLDSLFNQLPGPVFERWLAALRA